MWGKPLSTYSLKVVSEGHVTQLYLLCMFQFHWCEVGGRGGNWGTKHNVQRRKDYSFIAIIFARCTFPSVTFQSRRMLSRGNRAYTEKQNGSIMTLLSTSGPVACSLPSPEDDQRATGLDVSHTFTYDATDVDIAVVIFALCKRNNLPSGIPS